ncbi:MAG TPA: LL-diaminopimelate aminotransferase [Ottowia sp.]|uniref:LL-diaminopimelate aminotransferase n=1 Tax=Ottowia sp. TaxID=1898956 RepID=UPI002CA05F86|nr:LL-diaminopimelate aminotransferase [Ottowia sp.]HMN20668.1 LL-diaminopimelate aminotransferase [Ottowia sp.]
MRLNPHLAAMPGGYLFGEIARRVQAYEPAAPRPIIRLGIGDVTQPLAPAITQALVDAAREMGTPEGFHGYPPDQGYAFLRRAIIDADYAPLGVGLELDEVFITDGAKTDTSALPELLAADARVAVTDPVYPAYVDANAMAGRLGHYEKGAWSRLVTLPCHADNAFVPELPRERVDLLYLCYPNNPTGTVLTQAQLARFVAYALETDTLILFDAAYKAYITDPAIPRSIYQIPGAERVAVECCSFSKSAGFTGTRCAYTVIPKALQGRVDGRMVSLNALWARRVACRQNGVSYPVQRAAAAALSPAGQAQVAAQVQAYIDNAHAIVAALQGAGLEVFGGIHAPYVWLRIPGGQSAWDFFDHLLHRAQVVGTPGSGFGPAGEGYLRLTAFNTAERTREALARILAVL